MILFGIWQITHIRKSYHLLEIEFIYDRKGARLKIKWIASTGCLLLYIFTNPNFHLMIAIWIRYEK